MAAVLLLAPAANAQSVNEGAVRAKLEKSNADIANPKKNAKAATWLNRGKVYFESLQAPTKNLFMDLLDQAMLPTNMGGEPKSKTAEYWEYPWVKVYFNVIPPVFALKQRVIPGGIQFLFPAIIKMEARKLRCFMQNF